MQQFATEKLQHSKGCGYCNHYEYLIVNSDVTLIRAELIGMVPFLPTTTSKDVPNILFNLSAQVEERR